MTDRADAARRIDIDAGNEALDIDEPGAVNRGRKYIDVLSVHPSNAKRIGALQCDRDFPASAGCAGA